MSVALSSFLAAVDAIQAEAPTYRSGGKAADGTCDCIGLIIGALNRCGVKWPGIHGSNWAARNAMAWLLPVADAGDLSVGEIVYKAKRPGETGYALPDRYAKDPDRSDYYHVGVVRSVEPLRIVHCTSPGGVVVDAKVWKWAYRGWLKLIDTSASAGVSNTITGDDATMDILATVTAESGSTVNLRSRASTSSSLLERVPVGARVTILDEYGGWAKIKYGSVTGYMMSEFLHAAPSATDPVDTLEAAWEAIRALQLRVAALEGGEG